MNEKKITRKTFLKKAVKYTSGTLFASQYLFNIHSSSKNETLKIGYIPITDATPLLIAYANKYFKDEGLTAEKPFLIRTWSGLVEAFIAKKVNVVHLLFPIPLWMRYSYGSNVKVLAWDHTNGSAITVNATIKSFSDLGGKKIAVPYWYSMHNIILQMALKKFNLKPVIKPDNSAIKKDEVNLLILPPPEMPITLASKKIDGYTVAEPFNAFGEEKVNAKILRFTGDIWKNHPCCVIVMHDDMISSNPVFVQKVTNSITRAQSWINENRDKTAKILSSENTGLLPVEEKILKRVFNGYELARYGRENIPQAIKHEDWKINRIDFQPYPYPSATRLIYDEMKNTMVEGDKKFLNKYKSDFIVKDLIDDTFIQKSLKDLKLKFNEYIFDGKFERDEVLDI